MNMFCSILEGFPQGHGLTILLVAKGRELAFNLEILILTKFAKLHD